MCGWKIFEYVIFLCLLTGRLSAQSPTALYNEDGKPEISASTIIV